MANKHRGEAQIKIGGKKITLVPSFGNLAQVEAITGEGILALARRISSGEGRLTDLSAVIVACSKPEVSQNRAEAHIEKVGAIAAMGELGSFVVDALGGGQEGNEEAAKD